MVAAVVFAGPACPYHEAAVRNSLVIAVKFFLRDEVDGCVVIREVFGHRFNFILNPGKIRSLLSYHIAESCVLLSGGEVGIFPFADAVKRSLYGDGVLSGVKHAFNAAYGVGVTLTYALAPESVVLAVGENGVCVKSVE